MSYPLGPGVKQTVTERGWFAPPFTGCRFAVIAQIAVRLGYQVPLARQPNGVDNFVRDLQQAGDPTPKNGSTMRQGQKAVAALLPDAPFMFGKVTEAEFFSAITNGATVGFAVNCGKLPRYLKNYVGYGYNAGHYMAVDAAYDDGTVDLSDPMYRPARLAKPRRVPWADVSPAITKDSLDNIYVTLGFDSAAYYQQQLATAQAALAPIQAQIADLQAKLAVQTI